MAMKGLDPSEENQEDAVFLSQQLSKLQIRNAESIALKRPSESEDEYRFLVRKVALEFEDLAVECNHCHTKFDEWTNCLSISCSICSAKGENVQICGWCLKYIVGDAHPHVRHCVAICNPAIGLFCKESSKSVIMKKHLADMFVEKIMLLSHKQVSYVFNYLVPYMDLVFCPFFFFSSS